MPRKAATDFTGIDIARQFANRLEQAERAPTILRYKPMPAQEAFHKDQRRNRIAFGGNRAGKTWCGIADDIWILTGRHPYRNHLYRQGPRAVRVIGVDFDRSIAQAILPIVKQMLLPSDLINGSWEDSWSKSERILTLASGSIMSFMSYQQDVDQFASVSLDHAHFDEEPPKPIFDETMMRMLTTGGGWSMTETPAQQLEWVEDELIEPEREGRRPDLGVHYLRSADNDHVDKDALADLTRGMDAATVQMRLSGEYDRAANLVFPEFDLKQHAVTREQVWPRLRAEKAQWTFYESMDHGYGSPTAWLWTAVHPDGSMVTFKEKYAAEVTVGMWATTVLETRREIAQLLGYTPSWVPAGTYGDPAISQRSGMNGLSIQQEYARFGVYIATEGIRKTREGNQNVGLDKIHTYLSRRPMTRRSPFTQMFGAPWWQIVEEDAPMLCSEMRRARPPKKSLAQKEQTNRSEEIRDKDNHAIDAIKYLFMMRHELALVASVGERETMHSQMRGYIEATDEYNPVAGPERQQQWVDDVDPYGTLE